MLEQEIRVVIDVGGQAGEPDQKDVFLHGHPQTGEWRSANRFSGLELQYAHVADSPAGVIWRCEPQLDGVGGRQRRIKVAPEDHVEVQPCLRHLNRGAHHRFG